jgi:uncharacterized membrane protein YkoI
MNTWRIAAILSLAVPVGCSSFESMFKADTVEIQLGEVPAAAMQGAEKASPGAKFTSAEKKTKDGITTYELEGMASDGMELEVHVTAEGKVLELEKGADA